MFNDYTYYLTVVRTGTVWSRSEGRAYWCSRSLNAYRYLGPLVEPPLDLAPLIRAVGRAYARKATIYHAFPKLRARSARRLEQLE
jgi:hypothetical protein